MDVTKYILEFEHLNDKMLKFELKLPYKLLCLKLLDGVSLNTNQKQMVLTLASDLKYESMKAALKQILASLFLKKIVMILKLNKKVFLIQNQEVLSKK